MRPNWPKLANLAQNTGHLAVFSDVSRNVHCSHGLVLVESVYISLISGDAGKMAEQESDYKTRVIISITVIRNIGIP